MPDTPNNNQPIAAGTQPSAQTTPDTSYQGAQVTPDAQGPTGTPTPTGPPAPTAPTNTNTNTPAVQTSGTPATSGQAPTPTPHEALYSKFLKMLNPPSRYVDPTGKLQTQPQTGKNIGNNVLAAVLSGMMTPTTYRQGEFGPVADTQATAAAAFGAGQKQKNDQNEKAQKLSDDMQARKLQAVANNTAAMHSYASMMQAQAAAEKEGAEAEALQTKNWQSIADQNQSTIIASADEFDKNRESADAPKARLTSGMTTDELLQSPFKDKMTSQLMVQDGTRSEFDPNTGRSHVVPTWTVLNPDVDIKLNKAAVDRAAKVNPSFTDAWALSNGNVRMNLGRYTAITHQINSVDHAEDLLQSIADSKDPELMKLGIKGNVEGRLANAARNDPSAMKALMDFENAGAQGGNTADKLNRILQSGGGDAIFKALGTDRDSVQSYVKKVYDKQLSDTALAKEGGMGEKAPGAPDQINKLVDTLQPSTNLDADDSKALMADVPAPDKDGVIHMTQGQIEKLTARRDSVVTANKNNSEKVALANGDPIQMQKTASNTIEGDANDITKVASMRGNARENAINAIHDEAAARGLDTTQYSESALEAKANMAKDYAGGQKTPTGKQLVSFDNYLGHSAALLDAQSRLQNKTLGLTHTPIVNKTLKEIGTQLTDDKDWAAYRTALEPVKHEISNFLAAGYATKSEDASNMNALLSDTLPINQIGAVVKQLADTADVRLKGLGQAYVNTMGTTYPHLMSSDAQNALKRMGIDSKALPFTQTLPRGWNNHQPTMMTDKNMARAYFQAAGSDRKAAVELAKNNGWILQ